MVRNPILQVRVSQLVAEQVRQHARARSTDASEILRLFIEEGLTRAGFPPVRTKGGMPRVEARLRELVHRDPPVAGGGWLAIARELHRGYASPQKSRLRARLEWCIGERYILPDGPGHYVLVPGEIHRRLCPPGCSWLLSTGQPSQSSKTPPRLEAFTRG